MRSFTGGSWVVTTARYVAPGRRIWAATTAVVVVWEAAAGFTHVLHHRGAVTARLAYLTELVHRLPRLGRLAVACVIGAAVADHFDKRKVF